MGISRRKIVAFGATSQLLMLPGCARRVTSNLEFSTHSVFREQSAGVVSALGVQPPTRAEYDQSIAILDLSPASGAPLDVARFFAAIKEKNSEGEPYNAEWRVRANPLIVRFFLSTHTVPSGDTTAWCAAFVNWCFQRIGKIGSGSASSGSFRCLGAEAKPPSPGDVIVFRQNGFNESCQGKGHVGFFLRMTNDMYTVLGGNQKDAVRERNFAGKGTDLEVASIRSAASIT
jgi:uncharacterized protein (TIGR02594 family)